MYNNFNFKLLNQNKYKEAVKTKIKGRHGNVCQTEYQKATLIIQHLYFNFNKFLCQGCFINKSAFFAKILQLKHKKVNIIINIFTNILTNVFSSGTI